MPFHRIFCEMAITAQNFKKTVIFQKNDGFRNQRIPLKYEKLPELSFETGPCSKITILSTFFQKKRKYLCLDFTDCTARGIPIVSGRNNVKCNQRSVVAIQLLDFPLILGKQKSTKVIVFCVLQCRKSIHAILIFL